MPTTYKEQDLTWVSQHKSGCTITFKMLKDRLGTVLRFFFYYIYNKYYLHIYYSM